MPAWSLAVIAGSRGCAPMWKYTNEVANTIGTSFIEYKVLSEFFYFGYIVCASFVWYHDDSPERGPPVT